MSGLCTDVDRITQVWSWCKDAFARRGSILKFPEHTEPHKTYQWRYAKRLAETLEEWEFDDHTAIAFIDSAASYVKERKLLHKGLSAFFQSNILEVCYDRLESQQCNEIKKLESLRSTREFLDGQIRPTTRALLNRQRLGARYNIVEWFTSGNICKLYLALSASCTYVLGVVAKQDQLQRTLLPSSAELFCERSAIDRDQSLRREAEAILGSDWRKLCPRL